MAVGILIIGVINSICFKECSPVMFIGQEEKGSVSQFVFKKRQMSITVLLNVIIQNT
jgi:hypothetical protein